MGQEPQDQRQRKPKLSHNAAIGETKTILVNPANPSKPRDPVGTTSVPRGTMIVGLLLALSGCLGVFLYMKQR